MDKPNKAKTYERQTCGVLLVADDAEERTTIDNILVGHGMKVVPVSALSEYEHDPETGEPELVIVAVKDLDEEGFEAFVNMSIMQEGTEAPFLIVCDKGENVEWANGLAGERDFIRRPFDREDLLARLRILLKLSQQDHKLFRMREQLIRAQKLECVGALASGVVHEFNNLMFSVMGFAELARAKGGTDIEALRESAEISYETAKRATATATSLLAFSRQSKSLKSMENINDAVTSAVRLLKNNIEKNGISIELDLEEQLPAMLFSFGPMQQVFLNLVINAWHALDDIRGEKIIRIKTCYEASGKISVEVKDTGKGIPADIQDSIFEPFTTTKTSEDDGGREGTGLGLSIVKEVVREHGGIVELESEEGQGALFRIILPIEQEEGEDVILSEDAAEQNQEQFSVLIVDDEESNRRVLTRLLLRRGHEAYSAANMAEAMTLLWSKKIDIITMDMVMPHEDGVTNIERLREEGIDLPILICTGHVGQNAVARGLAAGANGVVMKPFSAHEFLTEMQKCVSESRLNNPEQS